eukprot:CAMPEP_0197900726 /NCGR_PEP_ID=MMETSP1439-20131203/49745_1 /TAXON_ID=66791 /ORGANISM="Gonyaulax spinifera, Strain CCMP409" /LENGTH=34 /DNA_ID= /DNA_START= /DNA_END= /DNA_ORIENTATION=
MTVGVARLLNARAAMTARSIFPMGGRQSGVIART